MNRLILFVFCTFILSSAALNATAQVFDGEPMDSTIIRFNGGSIPGLLPDTAGIPLWQIGRTHKSFFTTDTTAISMMTDTLHPYHTHANNWFVLKIRNGMNIIVDFWHKYQTDSTHAGGIVEFSTDHGSTWQNVLGNCNIDGSMGQGILTDNFYSSHDTLHTGEPAFTGTSGGASLYSRFQFFIGLPVKTASGTGCTLVSVDTFYTRFRFVSDTATDTLAGWDIDSIKIEADHYNGGAVALVNKGNMLHVFPNPSYDGSFIFPALVAENQFDIEVYNALGTRIKKMPYAHSLSLKGYPSGIYFYKVSDGTEYYSGQLQVE